MYSNRFYYNLFFGNYVVDGVGDVVGMVIKVEVVEKYGIVEKKSGRVGLVFVFDVKINVFVIGFEDGDIMIYVVVGNDIRIINESGSNVG